MNTATMKFSAITVILFALMLLVAPRASADHAFNLPYREYKGNTQIWRFGVGVDKSSELNGIGMVVRVGFRKILGDKEMLCLSDREWLWSIQLNGEWSAVEIAEKDDWFSPSLDLQVIPLSMSRVNCHEEDPIDKPKTELQFLPTRLSRALGLGERAALAVSLIGFDVSVGTGAKDQWTSTLPDKALRLVSRLIVQGLGYNKIDLDAEHDFKGLHFLRTTLEESATWRASSRCKLKGAAKASADFSGGTTGIFAEYGLGAEVMLDCLSKESVRMRSLRANKRKTQKKLKEHRSSSDIYFIKIDNKRWSDYENPGRSETKVLGGYERRF